jgi:hypothetical protein
MTFEEPAVKHHRRFGEVARFGIGEDLLYGVGDLDALASLRD